MKKHIITNIFGATLAAMISTAANASSWHFAWVGNEEVRYFFDAESIERSKDTVTVWVKTVQTRKMDNDGSWASALRWRFNCTKRTIQSLAASYYDQDGKFIRSSNNTSMENAVIPDSTGEGMLKIACKPTFPNDKSGNEYFKLEGNDVFQATRNYVKMMDSKKDVAPQ